VLTRRSRITRIGLIVRPKRWIARASHVLLATLLIQLISGAFTAALAQVPLPEAARSGREGLWLASGVGTVVRWVGRGSHISVGGTISHSLLLGVELIHYEKRGEDGLRRVHDNLSATAVFQPRSWPWGSYIKVGVGLASYGEQVYLEPMLFNIGSEGFGYTLGAGVDIPLIWRIAVTPSFDLLHSVGVKGHPPAVLLFSVGLTMQ
jgi:hypothetical protein